ncbi:hypothetical protein [Roseimaritima sediminicola]|uniref:hypothetical protein n=1 Tax=Roseimaritima sediminicola TaxID=2662066 RepID=UPI0012984676|nr:hypothetical protein [Roseimaritima sediminicola]
MFCALVLATAAGPVFAQVVQLPSQQQFRYRGSVMVPDGGSTYLGGNLRAAAGQTRRGFGPASAAGRSLSAGGLSVRAQIIDHGAIDRELLGGTPEQFLRRSRASEQPAEQRSAGAGRRGRAGSAWSPQSPLWPQSPIAESTAAESTAPESNARPPSPSPSPTAAADPRIEEGKAWVRQARRLRQRGELRAAAAAYRVAFPLLDDDLRGLARAEYRQLQVSPPR